MRLGLVVSIALVACGPNGRDGNGGIDAGVPVDAAPAVCSDGAHRCNGPQWQVCNSNLWITQDNCTAACDTELGCIACTPNVDVCQSGDVHSCDASGVIGGVTMACTGANICDGGHCVDACANAATNRSYVGCEYWAVDLDNALEVIDLQSSGNCSLVTGAKNVTMSVCENAANNAVAGTCDPPGNSCPSGYTCKSAAVCVLDAQHSPFAIVVSNPNSRAVNVTVANGQGMTYTTSVDAGKVQALLPQAAPQSFPDQSLDNTGTTKSAYKVTSDLPIVAYQFNPLDNVNVFSNDASLLIPRTAFDVEYYNMAWPTEDRRNATAGQPGTNDFYGYLTVVAWKDGTQVEITPTSAVQASATQTTIAAGTPTVFTLNAFETLNLEGAAPDGDLTGSHIKSVDGTTTFGVFGGQEAMYFGETTPPDNSHTDGPCCADHIEEMLFPTSTWGMNFAIARSQKRTNEPDVLRIVAQKPNTTVTFNPAPASGTCGTLAPGQFCQVKIAGDTAVTATQPVLIGHYLESSIWQDDLFGSVVGEGDPSMAIAVPVEQFRTDYTILIPSQYAKNFLSIATGNTGDVYVDGTKLSGLTSFGGMFRAVRPGVTAGQHKITCPNGCGVLVYGYSDAVSYMFAGGLDLKQIVIN